MVESAIAWILLFAGITQGSAQLLIASGMFAVACNVNQLQDILKDRNKGGDNDQCGNGRDKKI